MDQVLMRLREILMAGNMRIFFIWIFVALAVSMVFLCIEQLPDRQFAPAYLQVHLNGEMTKDRLVPITKERIVVGTYGACDCRLKAYNERFKFYLDHVGGEYRVRVQKGALITRSEKAQFDIDESFLIGDYRFTLVGGGD